MRVALHILIAVSVAIGVATSKAATISAYPTSEDAIWNPLSAGSSIDAFDVTNPGIVYGLGTGTVLNSSAFDVRDLFGGHFGTSQSEPGHVLFADNQSAGTVETITVQLPSPISIQHFDLYVGEDVDASGDGTGGRSMRELKVFAGSTLIDDVPILDDSGNESYQSVYDAPHLKISDDLTSVPSTEDYTIELVQNQNAGSVSGIRAVTFDAFVPEPTCFMMIAIGLSAALLVRPKLIRPTYS